MTRKILLPIVALSVLVAAAGAAREQPAASYDLLIRNGRVLDGTGNPWFPADVAVRDGRIAAVGRLSSAQAARVVDAAGKYVAPGFIDIHSHADGSLSSDPRAESVIRQGVTTIVVGQDGSSRGVVHPESEAADPPTLARFFESIEILRSAVNVASMVGLGSVRSTVVGADDRPATAAELAQMTAIVQRSKETFCCCSCRNARSSVRASTLGHTCCAALASSVLNALR